MRKRHETSGEFPLGAGFTLMEVLVSMTILLVGVAALVQLIPAALNYDLNNRSNSVALVVAQRELEQITQQSLTSSVATCPNANPATGSYSFCDTDGDPVSLGVTSTGSSPLAKGCPLTNHVLDFSQATAACDAGYFLNKTIAWNQISGVNQKVELRWRVITQFTNGTPDKKWIIIGARAAGGGAGSGVSTTLVNNLVTVVGP